MLIYTNTIKFEKFITWIFIKLPEKSKYKLPVSLGICSEDFMKCLYVELHCESTEKFTNNNTKTIKKLLLYLLYL